MGIDQKLRRFCDECGRSIVKPTRIQRGVEYCSTCYYRLFKPVPCAKCAQPVRVHRASTEKPMCRRCVAAARTCSRCGKGVPGKAGRVIDGQAICASCAPYFKPAETCEQCGRLSSRLSRAPSLGIEQRVCESCRNRASHITCAVCGKYRPASGEQCNGRPLCLTCVHNPSLSHACPTCGVSVPGSGQSHCRACTNRSRLEREVRLQAIALDRGWT